MPVSLQTSRAHDAVQITPAHKPVLLQFALGAPSLDILEGNKLLVVPINRN